VRDVQSRSCSAWGQRIWCGRTPRRPFSRVSSPWRTCHPPLRSRLPRCAMGCALEVRFALDSLVEGDGFERSVPLPEAKARVAIGSI
jgi:hypothetical protein